MSFARDYLDEVVTTADRLDHRSVDRLATELARLRARRGTLFLAGMGGSAANCTHAAADLRKLCEIDAVSLCDNVAELTARINDEGAHAVFADMLEARCASSKDALLVLSVGGGTPHVSRCLVHAVVLAKDLKMRVLGVVGRDGGYVKKNGDCVVLIPTVHPGRVTPHAEAFQLVVLHCLVSHPMLQLRDTKW